MADTLFVVAVKGKRPFGVSLLYIGWDKHYGFQLYQSDPSGNYGGWKATCIGNNSAVSILGVAIKSAKRSSNPHNFEVAMSINCSRIAAAPLL